MKLDFKVIIDTENDQKIRIEVKKQHNDMEKIYEELNENEKNIMNAFANFIEYVAKTV